MMLEEWKKEFESYVSTLGLPRDDYMGIMEYIKDGYSIMKQQRLGWPSVIGYSVLFPEYIDYCPGYNGND